MTAASPGARTRDLGAVVRVDPTTARPPSPAAAADDERQARGEPPAQADAEASADRSAPSPVASDVSSPPSPAVDAYSLRLVATRKLYDLGTDVAALAVAGRPRRRHRAAAAPARLRPPRRRRRRRRSRVIGRAAR